MKIAILGTRGIPNKYGGFEQCAEYLSVGLAAKGHNVSIYNPDFHYYKEPTYKGVKVIRKKTYKHLFGNSVSYHQFWFNSWILPQIRHRLSRRSLFGR